MRARRFLTAVVIAFIAPCFAFAQDGDKRPTWDQKKAIEKVKSVLAQEEKGDLAWDQIAWKTDPAEAAALAQKEQKPVFVFFFLKKSVGPVAAPC